MPQRADALGAPLGAPLRCEAEAVEPWLNVPLFAPTLSLLSLPPDPFDILDDDLRSNQEFRLIYHLDEAFESQNVSLIRDLHSLWLRGQTRSGQAAQMTSAGGRYLAVGAQRVARDKSFSTAVARLLDGAKGALQSVARGEKPTARELIKRAGRQKVGSEEPFGRFPTTSELVAQISDLRAVVELGRVTMSSLEVLELDGRISETLAGLGSFTVRLYAKGRVGRIGLTDATFAVDELAYAVADVFDFSGPQFLGVWSRTSGMSIAETGVLYGINKEFRPSEGAAPRSNWSGTALYNADFRDFATKVKPAFNERLGRYGASKAGDPAKMKLDCRDFVVVIGPEVVSEPEPLMLSFKLPKEE